MLRDVPLWIAPVDTTHNSKQRSAAPREKWRSARTRRASRALNCTRPPVGACSYKWLRLRLQTSADLISDWWIENNALNLYFRANDAHRSRSSSGCAAEPFGGSPKSGATPLDSACEMDYVCPNECARTQLKHTVLPLIVAAL